LSLRWSKSVPLQKKLLKFLTFPLVEGTPSALGLLIGVVQEVLLWQTKLPKEQQGLRGWPLQIQLVKAAVKQLVSLESIVNQAKKKYSLAKIIKKISSKIY